MKRVISATSIMLFFAVGVLLAVRSADSPLEVATTVVSKSRRDPAAIRKVYDFSNLDGSALSHATKQRILSGFQASREGDTMGISLGHFVVRGSNGQKQFACRRYSKVQLSFEGEGMAVGGEKPTMQVEGPCQEAEDINQISALKIPVSQILSEPVAEGEFDFQDGHNVKVRFASVADHWPSQWVLTGVKLTNDISDEVQITREEIRALSQIPVVVRFDEF